MCNDNIGRQQHCKRQNVHAAMMLIVRLNILCFYLIFRVFFYFSPRLFLLTFSYVFVVCVRLHYNYKHYYYWRWW